MDKIELLSNLTLGSSIAEQDENLYKYFINTNYVDEIINNKYDVVKGVKGAGKTAMLVALSKNQYKYEKLKNVKLVQAINLNGDPDFKRAFNQISESVEEQKLIDAWKIYIINLVWKSMPQEFEGYEELEKYLKMNNLITSKSGFLDKILHAFSRVIPKVSNTFNNDGTTTQTIEFDKIENKVEKEINDSPDIIDFNAIYTKIDKILANNNFYMWIMMDRLDDAFPDKSKKSIIALKTLFYAYKDILAYKSLKIKIFIRDDIYENITQNGFTSLSHVESKTLAPIEWNRSKLEQLLVERLLYNDNFKNYLSNNGIEHNKLDEEQRKNILQVFFRKQVDIGKKNPDSFGWIINHITDGLNTFTPRDLISLIDKARQYQIEEWRLNHKNDEEEYFIGASALRRAYQKTSQEKLQTQLYAEYPELRKYIEKFKDSKAEQNEESLKKILGSRWKSIVKKLVSVGFIEEKRNTWKIPFIYREGLGIVQGKAF